jgi:hypothetical protein
MMLSKSQKKSTNPLILHYSLPTIHCLLLANSGGGSPVNGFQRLMLLAPIPDAFMTALSPYRSRILSIA